MDLNTILLPYKDLKKHRKDYHYPPFFTTVVFISSWIFPSASMSGGGSSSLLLLLLSSSLLLSKLSKMGNLVFCFDMVSIINESIVQSIVPLLSKAMDGQLIIPRSGIALE